MLDNEPIFIVCVNLPGCLPESEPYAIRGYDNAYDCARDELDDCDSLGYSRAEWHSALKSGGANVYLESGYVVSVTPLDSLNLPTDEHAAYVRFANGEEN